METSFCPRCNRMPVSPTNRLITERCGHVKCRECFINDLDGCYECLQGSTQSIPDAASTIERRIHQQVDCFENPLNIEGDSLALYNTVVEDSATFEGPATTKTSEPTSAAAVEPANSINVIHNYSTNDSQQQASDSTESFKILEEYIIPPKTKIEKFFRERKSLSGLYERKKGVPDYVEKSVEGGETFYKCNACGKKFTSRSHQYYHANCGNGGSKRHKCKFCSKEFLSSSHLNYHVKSHHEINKYSCNLCTKTFRHIMNLRRHKRTHDGIYKYKCKECGLGFRETKTLTAHINKHRNIFPFVCKVCGKKFSFKSNLTQHQKIHTGLGKNYRCEDCGREFLRKNSYTEHMNRHAKVKNFQCKLCQTLFIDRKTLERHMNTHGSKYYNCPRCDVKCGRKDNLVRHIRNMHPNEDINDILKNIKSIVITNKVTTKSNRNKAHKSKSSTQATNSKDDLELPKSDKSSKPILASTSVIRSVGNVKPVQIPTVHCDLDGSSTQLGSIAPATLAEKANDCVVNNNNECSRQQPTINPPAEAKKPKKKYDPCEIYRKILFANDTDDSVLETDEFYSHSKDDHVGCCNDENHALAKSSMMVASSNENYTNTKRITDSMEPLNFGEIHWRKRTSQNFHTSL